MSTIDEKIKKALSDFLGVPINTVTDDAKLGDLGFRANQADALDDYIQTVFPYDSIPGLDWELTPLLTVGRLVHHCTYRIDINEPDRVFIVLKSMGLAIDPRPPLDTKLYELGINDANKPILIRRLQRAFSLHGIFKLDIKPDDISSKTTILNLIKHIETHLPRKR